MKKLYLLDASGYLYRSYFAISQMTNAKGQSTNALFGFIRSILKLLKDVQPEFLAAVFDGQNNTQKRKEIFPAYKSHRKETALDLIDQIQLAKEFCRRMGIPLLDIPSVEADDVMGSIACWAKEEPIGADVYLCTTDKDMCQLVNEKIFVLNTFKENLILTPELVEKQFGVKPSQIIDYLAITGDASDNVPGLPGFGPKTAADLLQTYESLEGLRLHASEALKGKKAEIFLERQEMLLLSRRLIEIDKEVECPHDVDFYELQQPSWGSLKEFYREMNFSSLMSDLDRQIKELQTEEKTDDLSYQLVDDEKEFKELLTFLQQQKEICFDTETTNLSPHLAELVGVGFGTGVPGQAWYVPTNGKLGLKTVLEGIKELFENPLIGFYGHHAKYDLHVLFHHGIRVVNLSFDTLLASYLLNTHSRQHGLDYLSQECFGKTKISIQELIGKGKQQISMKDVPLDLICRYCCEDVDYTMRLKARFSNQLEERGLSTLLYQLELPLLPLLAEMERNGIFVDTNELSSLASEVTEEIKQMEESIYLMAGESFNLNSPKQLSEILFQKLAIKSTKKTATGLSTNADVLENLKRHYPIAGAILNYRMLEKLRSTYIDALPKEINPKSGRIHCTFNQSGTATGRLSCQDPNLQNIPVRTKMGRRIRGAFRPEKPGWSYLSADYSQIELRLLAHLSQDSVLLDAFASGLDIHRYTAGLIFGVPIEEVSSEERNQAKAVNFGIIYGQQAFGLSQELGIEQKTAALFIEKYFLRYPKVKEFLESSKEKARTFGKAVTLFGRERAIPEINSSNGSIRAAAERLAVNTPLQGSQADIIKRAMIEIGTLLKNKKAKMILQIHDELLFEVPDEELKEVAELVRTCMEQAVSLNVRLIVDLHIGKNWKEC